MLYVLGNREGNLFAGKGGLTEVLHKAEFFTSTEEASRWLSSVPAFDCVLHVWPAEVRLLDRGEE